MFLNNDKNSIIKLVDFGLSCVWNAKIKLNGILGSPLYIAP